MDLLLVNVCFAVPSSVTYATTVTADISGQLLEAMLLENSPSDYNENNFAAKCETRYFVPCKCETRYFVPCKCETRYFVPCK